MQPEEKQMENLESGAECRQREPEAQSEGVDAARQLSVEAPVRRRRRWPWLLVALFVVALGGECVQRWRIERAIDAAFARLDCPYVLGAEGPNAYDCSSLVQCCFADAWTDTPRLAVDIGYCDRYPTIEARERLLRGDVVCFDTVSDRDLSDHVGIYLGDNRFVHASSGKGKVVVSELTGYYAEHFSWGKRLIRHVPVDLPFLLTAMEQEQKAEK
ncbi:MAG: NlpC/P60 family protein [Clostridia bacterium]|nr:NlpC/P60 family protein [Clostridia bacterium]